MNYSFIPGFGSMYGLLIMHMMSASVHLTFVKAFKSTINLKPVRPGQYLEFKAIVIEEINKKY